MRDQAVGRLRGRRPDLERLVKEAEEDQPEECRDRELEAAVAVPLQREDPEGNEAGDHARRQERHVEEQVQTERGTEKLGDVRGHRDELGLDPHAPGEGARIVLAEVLRKVTVGDDSELRRQILDQHRHQVGGDDHPHEQVAELGAGPDVRGEVPRVDVCDRGDECRAEHRQRRLPAALGEDSLDRAQADRVDGGGGFERGRHASSETRIARAKVAPSTCTSPPERA